MSCGAGTGNLQTDSANPFATTWKRRGTPFRHRKTVGRDSDVLIACQVPHFRASARVPRRASVDRGRGPDPSLAPMAVPSPSAGTASAGSILTFEPGRERLTEVALVDTFVRSVLVPHIGHGKSPGSSGYKDGLATRRRVR
jgi:hypothetical protein